MKLNEDWSNLWDNILSEDLVTDSKSYTYTSIVSSFGSQLETGSITKLINIKNVYKKNILYDAISSSFMRVCINLKHRTDITDEGWVLYENGIIWKFTYNGTHFLFVSTDSTFDIYASSSGSTFQKVLHSDHSHCSNMHDVNEVLEVSYTDSITGTTTVNKDELRAEVKSAVEKELRSSVSSSISTALGASISGRLGGMSGISHGSAGGTSSAPGRSLSNFGIDIDKIVDAVMKVIEQKFNI